MSGGIYIRLGFDDAFITTLNIEPPATVAFSTVGTVSTYGSKTNTTVDAADGIEEGDLILVALFIGSGTSVPTITPPSGFTSVSTPTSVTDGDFLGEFHVFKKIAGASEASSYTFNHLSASTQGVCVRVSGSVASSPVIGYSKGQGNSAINATIPGQSVRRDGSLLVYFSHGWESFAKDAPSGVTERAEGILVFAGTQDSDIQDVSLKTQAVNTSSFPWSGWLIQVSPYDAGDVTSGFPTELTTGYSGSLTTSGGITTSSDNQIIENLDITTDGIYVQHDNVIIRNCRITSTAAWSIDCGNKNGTLIEDCEIDGNGTASDCILLGSNAIVRRCNLYNAENGISISGNGSQILSNYIHNLFRDTADPHYDGIQNSGASDISIIGNNIRSFDTSCILFQNEFSGFSGTIIQNNLLYMSSGAAHIYLRGDKAGGPILDALVENNIFDGNPSSFYDLTSGPSSLTWTGNITPTYRLVEV